MVRMSVGLLVLGLSCSILLAQTGKGIRFWNLTDNTVKEFYLSPAGKDEWAIVRNIQIKDASVFSIEEKAAQELQKVTARHGISGKTKNRKRPRE
jgi:hypothetical protein